MAEKQRASHSFVVRIWRESGLVRPAGRPLWRGRVQHAASGEYRVFQSMDEMVRFIQSQIGDLSMKRSTIINEQFEGGDARENKDKRCDRNS